MSPIDRTLHTALAALGVFGVALMLAATPTLAAAKAPVVTSQSVSAVTQTSAILNAAINPHRQDSTYHFEYGPNIAYGTSMPVPDANIGAGSSELVVGQLITGLEPERTYHYRVATSYTNGAETIIITGEDQIFTTLPPLPPIAETTAAVDVSQNDAILIGAIDARGLQCDYEFDIGADSSYGTRIFGDAGFSTGPQIFTVTLSGLAAERTYHYRILATNPYGMTYGADQTFTTPGYFAAELVAPTTPLLIPTPVIAPASTNSIDSRNKATKYRHLNQKHKQHKKQNIGGQNVKRGQVK